MKDLKIKTVKHTGSNYDIMHGIVPSDDDAFDIFFIVCKGQFLWFNSFETGYNLISEFKI